MTTTEIAYNGDEFKQALMEAYEQFKEANPNIPEQDAGGEAAYWIIDGNFELPEPLGDTPKEAYTLPQYVYYLEAILTTPDLPLHSYISYHLLEDNYEIDGMIQDGLLNAMQEYMKSKAGYPPENEIEPVPDTELPTETPEDITEEFESIINESSETEVTTEDEFPFIITRIRKSV
jgi:hypothetical protein